jgi:hypothetical protein
MSAREIEVDIVGATDGRISLVLICRDSTGAVIGVGDAKR